MKIVVTVRPCLRKLAKNKGLVATGAKSPGRYTSIALDGSGYPHISYCDATNTNLKYVYAYCGYVLAADLNDDCKFDFHDFALTSRNWLIDCDQTPQDPNCVPK